VQRVGLVLVITLVSYEVLVLLKFALVMWKLKTEGAFKLVGLTPQRLKRRLNYMTNRFSTYAQFHWQFVIWLRLVLLIFISLLPKILEAVQRTAQGTSLLTAEQIKKEEAQLESTIWFHAAIAMVVIAIFGLWSARVAPYRWRFQNIIENSLFVCDILAIALGMAYTLLNQQQKDFAETVSSNVIEFLLIVFLFGSMGVALVVVIVKHRRDVAQRQEEEAEQEIKDEYRSEATDGMTRENVQRLARTNEKIVLRRRPSQQIIGRGIQRGLGGVKGILGGRAARPDDAVSPAGVNVSVNRMRSAHWSARGSGDTRLGGGDGALPSTPRSRCAQALQQASPSRLRKGASGSASAALAALGSSPASLYDAAPNPPPLATMGRATAPAGRRGKSKVRAPSKYAERPAPLEGFGPGSSGGKAKWWGSGRRLPGSGRVPVTARATAVPASTVPATAVPATAVPILGGAENSTPLASLGALPEGMSADADSPLPPRDSNVSEHSVRSLRHGDSGYLTSGEI
jgi:hypothetical protein